MSAVQTLNVRRVLARNTAWNYASAAVGLVVNLVLFRYVVFRIGDTAAGIWLLLSAVNGYLGLMQLGVVPAVTQLIAARLERNDHEHTSRLASTTMALLAVIGLAAIALAPAVPALVTLLNIPSALEQEARLVFVLGLISFSAQLPGQAFNAFVAAAQRQDRCAQAWILSLLLKLVGVIVVLELGFGLTELVVMELCLVVLMDLCLGAMAFSVLPDLRLAWGFVNRADLRLLVNFGGVLLVVRLCAVVIEQTDRFVIGAFLPLSLVTYYSGAWKLYVLAYVPTTTLLHAVSPLAAALAGRSASEDLRTLVLRMSKYSAAVGLALVAVLGFGAPAILNAWMGPAFAQQAHVAQILLIGFAVTAYNHAGFAALVGTQRVTAVAWQYSVPQAILNLVISLWLVGPLGLTGVALGTLIPAIGLQPLFMKRMLAELGIDWRAWWMAVLVPTLRPAFCFVPAIFAYRAFDNPSSWLMLGVAIGCSLAYATSFYLLSLPRDERAQLTALLRPSARLRPAP